MAKIYELAGKTFNGFEYPILGRNLPLLSGDKNPEKYFNKPKIIESLYRIFPEFQPRNENQQQNQNLS